jgi:enolase
MSATTIAAVHARTVYDSRGRPTVEAEVRLVGGATGRGIAPAGASRGRHEAVDLRDGGAAFGGFGVAHAVENARGPLARAIAGLEAADQAQVDRALIVADGTLDKGRLGGNAIVALSLANLDAAARAAGMPTWAWLAQGRPVTLPMPEIQVFGGGAHAGRRVDIQDFMVVPVGAKDLAHALAMVAEVYRAAGVLMAEAGKLAGVADEGGYWPVFATNEEALDCLVRAIARAGLRPGDDVAISLDVAASEFGHDGRYRLGLERRELDTAGMIDLLSGWLARYPIVSIEDPLAEDDAAGLAEFTRRFGARVQVVGDDYLVTNADRVALAARRGACNAALIKVNQAGTVTEARAALDAARAMGWGAIVSARSGETEDVAIVHLAVGWAAGQLKVGSFARSERMAKWNECLRVEEALGAHARFAGWPPSGIAGS